MARPLSSVIEALSGIDLPRGEGIQTRVPLELRLRRVAQKADERATLQITGHAEVMPVSLDKVGAAVREKTEELARPQARLLPLLPSFSPFTRATTTT